MGVFPRPSTHTRTTFHCWEIPAMKRREMLLTTGAAAVGLSAFPFRWVAAAEKKNQKVLYFTRSAGYVHSVVDRHGKKLAYSEEILTGLGQKHGFEVVCSQDPAVFDGDLDQYDLIMFFTSGNPLAGGGEEEIVGRDPRRQGFCGHPRRHRFVPHRRHRSVHRHDRRRIRRPSVATAGDDEGCFDPKFPGMAGLGDDFALFEEWYAFRKFAPDLHVVLVQETAGMNDAPYQRPPYPATWARMYGKGRVFYTSMGHREDVWTNPKFQQVLLGGIAWALGNAEADVTPNIAQVTPGANQLTNYARSLLKNPFMPPPTVCVVCAPT